LWLKIIFFLPIVAVSHDHRTGVGTLGREMGLLGDELKEFVKEQQTLARADRQSERDAQDRFCDK